MSLTLHLHLPHRPAWGRIPRQGCVAATCWTPGCTRRGLDVLPSLGCCPACGLPLTETRAVTQ